MRILQHYDLWFKFNTILPGPPRTPLKIRKTVLQRLRLINPKFVIVILFLPLHFLVDEHLHLLQVLLLKNEPTNQELELVYVVSSMAVGTSPVGTELVVTLMKSAHPHQHI